MTQWDEVGCSFRRLNTCNAGNTKNIPFFMRPDLNHTEGFREHRNLSYGNSNAMGMGFIANIHHMGLAARIKMS